MTSSDWLSDPEPPPTTTNSHRSVLMTLAWLAVNDRETFYEAMQASDDREADRLLSTLEEL